MALHVGVLTGGGDCPGLNAVIRAVTLALVRECGARVSGIERGFEGLLSGRTRPLAARDVQDILDEGGTILGTQNRCNPFRNGAEGADRSAQALGNARALGIDALVVIGGDGTMEIAHRFAVLGLPIVGVPKTIDNDLLHNERSFGFDSAVAVVADALDRLATTARSHGRVMIVETMGRHAGWIALEGGLAGAADVILLPELAYEIDAVAAQLREHVASQQHAILCVAEGAAPVGGTQVWQTGADGERQRLGGLAHQLEGELAPRLPCEVRATVLGHLQRGGRPTPFDRVLATQLGYEAAGCVRRGEFGRMVAVQRGGFATVPLAEVASGWRAVPADHALLRAASGIGIGFGTTAR